MTVVKGIHEAWRREQAGFRWRWEIADTVTGECLCGQRQMRYGIKPLVVACEREEENEQDSHPSASHIVHGHVRGQAHLSANGLVEPAGAVR